MFLRTLVSPSMWFLASGASTVLCRANLWILVWKFTRSMWRDKQSSLGGSFSSSRDLVRNICLYLAASTVIFLTLTLYMTQTNSSDLSLVVFWQSILSSQDQEESIYCLGSQPGGHEAFFRGPRASRTSHNLFKVQISFDHISSCMANWLRTWSTSSGDLIAGNALGGLLNKLTAERRSNPSSSTEFWFPRKFHIDYYIMIWCDASRCHSHQSIHAKRHFLQCFRKKLSKFRNRLDVDHDIRCCLANTQPRISELVKKRQYQGSYWSILRQLRLRNWLNWKFM